jgi:hypothetical protein
MESDKQKFREIEAEAMVARKELRDVFAMAALQGMLASGKVAGSTIFKEDERVSYAKTAYDWADAMLKAREQ